MRLELRSKYGRNAIFTLMMMALVPVTALAESFHCISNSNSCAAVPSLSWSVSGNSLTITNHASDTSYIQSVHFSNDAGMNVLGVTGWTGAAVAFRKANSIGETLLPDGFAVGFLSDVSWTAEGNNRRLVQINGVGAGESITFGLAGASETSLREGKMRVGVNLQGLTDETGAPASISLVTAAPKPGAYAMLIASLFGGLAGGLVLVGAVVRHRSAGKHA